MTELRKMPGRLIVGENGKAIYSGRKRWDCDYERFAIMTTNDTLLECLRHITPGDLRVFFAVVRRVDHLKGYAVHGDYKTIADDLQLTPTVAFKAIQRLAHPVVEGKEPMIRALQWPQDGSSDAGKSVVIVNPDVVVAGRHEKSRTLWLIACRAADAARDEKERARQQAEDEREWAEYRHQCYLDGVAADEVEASKVLDALAAIGVSPEDAEYHLYHRRKKTGAPRVDAAG